MHMVVGKVSIMSPPGSSDTCIVKVFQPSFFQEFAILLVSHLHRYYLYDLRKFSRQNINFDPLFLTYLFYK